MKKTIFAAYAGLLAFSACGNDSGPKRINDTRPVDGLYRAAIATDYTDDCNVRVIPADGAAYIVDVLLRGNGNLDIRHGSIAVPGPWVYEDVVHDRGNIDHSGSHDVIGFDGSLLYTERYAVQGTLTPDSMNLMFTNEHKGCTETAYVAGTPRPLADPDALDGHYILAATEYGNVCPGDPLPIRDGWHIAAEVNDDGISEHVGIVLAGQMSIWPDRPSPDGTLDWEGDWMWYADPMMLEMTGGLEGTLSPKNVDLMMTSDFLGYENTCPQVTTFVGKKRIPSLTAIDNDYRLHVDVESTCIAPDDDPEWTLERTGSIIMQSDTLMEFTDFTGTYLLELDGDAFSTTFGTPGVWSATLAGTVTPPSLDYSVVYTEYDDDRVTCGFTATIAGHVRYVFP